MYNYHLSGEMPTEFWIKMALASFINQWERDSEKWEKAKEIRKENGRKGGLMKSQNKRVGSSGFENNPLGLNGSDTNPNLVPLSDTKQDLANVAVNVNGNGNVNGNLKVTKEKKSIKKEFEPPTLDEVKAWFIENGSTAEAGAKAWQYYTDGNWCDSKGSPVKNWRQKMRGGRWLEVQPQQRNEGNQYQNLTHETTYTQLDEFNNIFTAE
jgi:hypothetical protein